MDWWKNREAITLDGFDKAKCYSTQELADGGYNLDLCGFPHEEEEEILPPDLLIRVYFEKKGQLDVEIKKVLEQMTNLLNQD
jgi:type I restriction enzyme M protein